MDKEDIIIIGICVIITIIFAVATFIMVTSSTGSVQGKIIQITEYKNSLRHYLYITFEHIGVSQFNYVDYPFVVGETYKIDWVFGFPRNEITNIEVIS